MITFLAYWYGGHYGLLILNNNPRVTNGRRCRWALSQNEPSLVARMSCSSVVHDTRYIQRYNSLHVVGTLDDTQRQLGTSSCGRGCTSIL